MIQYEYFLALDSAVIAIYKYNYILGGKNYGVYEIKRIFLSEEIAK